MKRMLAAVMAIVIGLTPATVSADVALTQAVNAAWFERTIDSQVIGLATARAQEISIDFSHNGVPSGYAEVIAWNNSTIAGAVQQWKDSPPHNAILSDSRYAVIGCGSFGSNGKVFYVCLLPWGTTPAPPAPPAPAPTPAPVVTVTTPTPAPVVLPDTAMRP